MPSSFDQYKTAFLGGIYFERGSTHNLVEELLRSLDQQVSKKWNPKGPLS
jgi:hypothetical protein